jgi:hypothetical protein
MADVVLMDVHRHGRRNQHIVAVGTMRSRELARRRGNSLPSVPVHRRPFPRHCTDYSVDWICTAAKRRRDEAFVKVFMQASRFFAVTASSNASVRWVNHSRAEEILVHVRTAEEKH